MTDAQIVMLHEIPGVYDGWSVAEYSDGTFVNRWNILDRQYDRTQAYIAELEARRG